MMRATLLVLLTLLPADARAQQRTVYDANGSVSGRITRDSGGASTIYDAGGRVTGRTSTDSQGTVTIYDAAGRRTGTVTGGRR